MWGLMITCVDEPEDGGAVGLSCRDSSFWFLSSRLHVGGGEIGRLGVEDYAPCYTTSYWLAYSDVKETGYYRFLL